MTPSATSILPTQTKLVPSVEAIPVEYFPWGTYPDHFKIDMPHRHAFSELLFFSKGGGIHEIGYKDFDIEDYSIHFIPKSTIHFLKRDTDSTGFTIAFDDAYFERNDIHKFRHPFAHEAFSLSLPKDAFQELLIQTQIIKSQIDKDEACFRKKCFLLSMELLMNSIAAEKTDHSEEKIQDSLSELARKFQYLVQTNFHQEHRVAWYAAQLCIAPKSLGNLVKAELNISPKQFIQQALLISVKQQLINSSKSIKEIALDHSCDASQLGKLFKKEVGYTMKAYRS